MTIRHASVDFPLAQQDLQHEAETAAPAADARATHTAQIAGLFREHNRSLVAFLRSRLDSLAEAQEVAQEAYARLLRLERPEQVGFLRAYLFRIAQNLVVDRLRQRQVREQSPEHELFEDWLETPAPERRALAADQVRTVREALRELPRKSAAAFVLHVVEGQDFAVIAASMRLTERMVRYHVARALEHCRARLDAEDRS